MCDLLFVPPFPFQLVANLSKSNPLKDRFQEDARLSCLNNTTTMPVHDSNITTTLASGPLPSLNTTEHLISTTAPSIPDLPVGQQATGQEQQQPAFIPNNAHDGAATVKKAEIVPMTALSLRFKQLEISNDCALKWILYVSISVQLS